ncbi:MAG TPA: hypothetical protein VMZ28_22105 [Kofleriaceae bacterium]|nr:hypothetical protein [Kofleriaceae bacterium]
MRLLLPTTFALALAACGASEVEIHRAKTSGYQTDFAIVYSETLEAVRDLYPTLEEDARAGSIKTAWHPIHIQTGQPDSSTPNQQQQNPNQAFQQTVSIRERFYVRFEVAVVGGRPWRVRVDGFASSWKAGDIPTPLKGPAIPSWLKGRTEALQLSIYRRLKKYAVKLKTEKLAGPPAQEAPDVAKFHELPPDAAKVVAEAEQASGARDVGRLRAVMADDFTYSFGDAPSADTAVLVWKADATILSELNKTLGAGCAMDTSKGQVVCPAAFLTDGNFTGYRAGFARVNGHWKMTFFVAGD